MAGSGFDWTSIHPEIPGYAAAGAVAGYLVGAWIGAQTGGDIGGPPGWVVGGVLGALGGFLSDLFGGGGPELPSGPVRWKETHWGGDPQGWAKKNGIYPAWVASMHPLAGGVQSVAQHGTQGMMPGVQLVGLNQSEYANCIHENLETGAGSKIGPLCIGGTGICIVTGSPPACIVGGGFCLAGVAVKAYCTAKALGGNPPALPPPPPRPNVRSEPNLP